MTSRAFPHSSRASLAALVGLAWLAAPSAASAQGAPSAATTGLADSPSPYYLGASEAITYDSNVFHRPPESNESSAPSGSYSSTSLLAGFSQPISRQRVFGTADVSVNRYLRQSELNNTSYDLLSGLDWATAGKLTGNVTATLDQQRVAPAAIDPAIGDNRTLQRRKGVFGSAQWGGDSQFTVLSRLGYSTQDYSSGSFDSDSRYAYGSLGAFYRPGSLLRLGVAARFDQTKATYSSSGLLDSDLRGRHLDFLVDYNNGSSLTASGRLSYTRETNRNLDAANFSGLTGNLDLAYRATGKISFNLGGSRDAGFNASPTLYAGAVALPPADSTPPSANTPATLYENNQVTDSLHAGAIYQATSKIRVSGDGHYARARIITSVGSLVESIVDETRGARLAVDYTYSRAITFSCGLSRDRRVVSGATSYAYTDDTATCSAQFLWR